MDDFVQFLVVRSVVGVVADVDSRMGRLTGCYVPAHDLFQNSSQKEVIGNRLLESMDYSTTLITRCTDILYIYKLKVMMYGLCTNVS